MSTLKVINTREALDAVPNGTVMADGEGYRVRKDGPEDFLVLPPVEDGPCQCGEYHPYWMDAGEIGGDYSGEDESPFFPLTVLPDATLE